MRWRNVFTIGGPSALALGISALVWDRVPERMPIHWDAHGVANGWAPKAVGLLLLPLTAILVSAVTRWAMGRGKAGAWADLATVATGGFMAVLHAMMIHAALTPPHGLDTSAVVGLIGALTAGMGLVLPHLSQNRWAGVRTPWTLADEVNWKLTHEFAAWTMGIGGAVAILAGLVLSGAVAFGVGIAAILIGSLAPLPYSYAIHRLRRQR